MVRYIYVDEEYSWFIKIREVNFYIILLVYLVYLIILIVRFGLKLRLRMLFRVLVLVITLNDLIKFFFLYEIVFILIMFTIMLLGYRFERLIAAFIIIFYSFLFSRPRIIILLLFNNRFLMKQ